MNTQEPFAIAARGASKRFGHTTALLDVRFEVPLGRIVGLVGRNGSGKTTLLRCLQGLALPTSGHTELFGVESAKLADADLARLGVVQQESRFLSWMSGRAHLEFVGSFYERWDKVRERRLVSDFDLDLEQRIGAMSPGALQKLALVTATCHHPQVLLLDEPAAALDPPSREALHATLFTLLREDGPAILVSSHQLDDIERTVDWILCLDAGRIVRDEALDSLQERYAQWRVLPAEASASRAFPQAFREPWIRSAQVEPRGALLLVENAECERERFQEHHGVVVDVQPVRLSQMFRLWTAGNVATTAPSSPSRSSAR